MASNWSICGVCDSLQVCKAAVVWCPDCDEGLCDECEKRHSVSRASKEHHTIPIDKYLELSAEVFRINQMCSIHNDKFQIYCKKHDCPCCHRCVIETHNTCKDLTVIDDIVKNVKSSNAFLEMEESLKEIANNMAKVFERIKSNRTSLRNEKNVLEKNIIDTRERINKNLDAIQLSFMTELADLEEKENQMIEDLVMELRTKESILTDKQKKLNYIKEHATELQTFLAMKEIEKDIRKEEECLNILCSRNATQEIHLVFKMNKMIQTFENDIKYFGQVAIEYQQSSLVFDKKKEKEAQIKSQNSIENISINLVRPVGIDSQHITSTALLPEGRFVFSCNSENVIVTKPDGSKDFSISLKPYHGRDVTYIPSINSLAVPCNKSHKHCIRMVDLDKRKVTHSFTMDDDNYGIFYKEDINSLVIIRGKGIQIMNLQDKSVKTVMGRTIPGTPYITAFGDSVYFTINSDSKSFLKKSVSECVKCCDLQGNVKWVFTEDKILKSPKGITVDNEGYVYVVGYHSNNVIVLSPSGSQHTVLLSSRDGLEAPTGIDYDMSTKQLLVANQSGKAFLYNIKKP